jgi:dynein intermediate chain 2
MVSLVSVLLTIAMWDSRKGKDPIAVTPVEKSHSDPVTHFQWQMTKTGQECVSISTDGYCHFWDTRKMKEDRVESLEITENNADGKEVLVGGTTLENSSEAVTILMIFRLRNTLSERSRVPF